MISARPLRLAFVNQIPSYAFQYALRQYHSSNIQPPIQVVFKALIVLHTMIRNGATDNILAHLSQGDVLKLRNVSGGNWEGLCSLYSATCPLTCSSPLNTCDHHITNITSYHQVLRIRTTYNTTRDTSTVESAHTQTSSTMWSRFNQSRIEICGVRQHWKSKSRSTTIREEVGEQGGMLAWGGARL